VSDSWRIKFTPEGEQDLTRLDRIELRDKVYKKRRKR